MYMYLYIKQDADFAFNTLCKVLCDVIVKAVKSLCTKCGKAVTEHFNIPGYSLQRPVIL